MKLILVRHGHAGHKLSSGRADRQRPLTRRGAEQAERLAEVLLALRPKRIVSSPFTRCLETVAPLAEATGVPVGTSVLLTPARRQRSLSFVRRISSAPSRSSVVVCTHGEVLGVVLGRMAADSGIDLERRPPGLKGCAWVLDVRGGRLVDAEYVVP